MDVKKNMLLLLFIGSITMSQAQNSKGFIPVDIAQKEQNFVLPELLIDSAFIVNLSTVIFGKEGCGVEKCSKWNNFYITFEAIDSTNYSICLSLWNIPAKKALGFFEYNDFFYWLSGEIPPNIILKTKSKKQFSYKDPISAPYDPPSWNLTYYNQTGYIRLKGKNCY